MTHRESVRLVGGLIFVLGCCVGPIYPVLGFVMIAAFFVMGACACFGKVQ